MLIKRWASVASGSLSAWRATRAAHFLKSGTSDILHSSNSGPTGESRGMCFRFKKACEPQLGSATAVPAALPDRKCRCYRPSCGGAAGSGAPPTEMRPAGLSTGNLLRGAVTAGRAGAAGGGAGAAAVCSASSLAANAES